MTAEESLPTQRLMQAVILQAIRDAIGQKADSRLPSRIERDRRIALAWFEDAGTDFQEVCDGAGLSPIMVRRFALDYIRTADRLPRKEQAGVRHRNPLSVPSIAAHAGVSASAVRNVLNRDIGSPAMKALVRKTAQDLANLHRIAA